MNVIQHVLASSVLPLLVACTYDFDQFVNGAGGAGPAGSGSESSGGTTANSHASGGKASNSAGSSSISNAGSTSSGTAQACAGSLYQSICWYLGTAGSSCDQVCSIHGQPAANAASFIGTSTQGGSLEQCTAILTRLGVAQSPTMGARSDGSGLGCHVYSNVSWWLSSPAFSASASNGSARIACGCTR